MKRLPILVVVLLALVVTTAAAAFGLALATSDDTGSGPGMHYSGDGSGPMMHSSSVTSEHEFLIEMVAHHREAVAAARELARSDRSELRAFGTAIVAVQSAQIDQMTAWLGEWYPDESTTADYRPMMRDLSDLSGDRLDETFLEDMIGHHMAAVMMSQQLLARGVDHDDVADLARSIRDDQHAEILQMQRWLAEWFDTAA